MKDGYEIMPAEIDGYYVRIAYDPSKPSNKRPILFAGSAEDLINFMCDSLEDFIDPVVRPENKRLAPADNSIKPFSGFGRMGNTPAPPAPEPVPEKAPPAIVQGNPGTGSPDGKSTPAPTPPEAKQPEPPQEPAKSFGALGEAPPKHGAVPHVVKIEMPKPKFVGEVIHGDEGSVTVVVSPAPPPQPATIELKRISEIGLSGDEIEVLREIQQKTLLTKTFVKAVHPDEPDKFMQALAFKMRSAKVFIKTVMLQGWKIDAVDRKRLGGQLAELDQQAAAE